MIIGPRDRVTAHDPSRSLVEVFGKRVAASFAAAGGLMTLADLRGWTEHVPSRLRDEAATAFGTKAAVDLMLWVTGRSRRDPGPGPAFADAFAARWTR